MFGDKMPGMEYPVIPVMMPIDRMEDTIMALFLWGIVLMWSSPAWACRAPGAWYTPIG